MLRYWDANAFLGLLKREPDKYGTCVAIHMQARAGECRIVTSAITFVEVIHLNSRTGLTQSDEEKIEAYFEHEWINIVEVDRQVGILARQLLWRNDHLKTKDAIHAATAMQARVDVLETYDPDLLRLQALAHDGHNVTIRRPFTEQATIGVFDQEVN